jgi:hypothetical protein
MDTFQTPPTQQKCLLFYWPLIFLSGTFYVLILLVATFSPLYNLSTPCMHSSVLGVPMSRTTSTLLSDLLCSDHYICSVMQTVPSSQQQLVYLWLLPCLLYYVTLSSMVVPLYVNYGAALQHFSNTTTLVLLTLMTNYRSTQNSDRTSICFCHPCGVSDINAKSSAYSSNLIASGSQ